MSASDENSGIFLTDTPKQIKTKVLFWTDTKQLINFKISFELGLIRLEDMFFFTNTYIFSTKLYKLVKNT